ncbi:hypothetical protein AVEN_144530-1 [Araneus ventricosus]|uniref:Uncharacterized protein n=1 Tax=Araneus ventricosus TaxID=182803 RepID=A0A4Y2ISH6_ARAVE|nr:hypothetical protein AVEN_144530-1 [Araneus ventricosus]
MNCKVDTVMSLLFPTRARPATPTEVPEGTTQEERKWVIKLPTLRKPTGAHRSAVSLTDNPRVSRQRDGIKSDHIQSTPWRKAHDCGWVICPS